VAHPLLDAMSMKPFIKTAILGATLVATSLSLADNRDRNPLAGTNKPQQGDAKLEAAHLDLFDDLDYNVFSGQQWADLHRSHAKDVIVHWPDGHVTKGIDRHIEDLKAMFVFAPDTRIQQHPVKIAKGDWTAVMGVMEGTFTKPMPIGDGKLIQPTNKPYKINMATISHWTKEGPMDEEYLFWDNQEFMKEIGLGK
jgi:SnoaL-like polyketide cyclase